MCVKYVTVTTGSSPYLYLWDQYFGVSKLLLYYTQNGAKFEYLLWHNVYVSTY